MPFNRCIFKDDSFASHHKIITANTIHYYYWQLDKLLTQSSYFMIIEYKLTTDTFFHLELLAYFVGVLSKTMGITSSSTEPDFILQMKYIIFFIIVNKII